ncbi:MAG: hypothetical protein K5755_04220 [Clostridiales bacterium]|nr:hypothetical protein [Clostridiales bacterium]
MSNEHADIKISPDEYFERQKNAETVCRKKIKHLIIRSIILLGILFFLVITLEFNTGFFIDSSLFLVWFVFIIICLSMFIGSLYKIKKSVDNYKFSLKRIEEYMLSGGIVIEIPKEDYEKFDLFKSKKYKYKAKTLNQMKNDERKAELEKQKRLEQEEYEKRVEEEFKKQYYPDAKEDNNN